MTADFNQQKIQNLNVLNIRHLTKNRIQSRESSTSDQSQEKLNFKSKLIPLGKKTETSLNRCREHQGS